MQTRAELEEEREKTRRLYHSFLPASVADQMLKGEKPDAGRFHIFIYLFTYGWNSGYVMCGSFISLLTWMIKLCIFKSLMEV